MLKTFGYKTEAGHAVALSALGVPIARVTFERTSSVRGVGARTSRIWVGRIGIVLYAGAVAAEEFLLRAGAPQAPSTEALGAGEDRRELEEKAASLGFSRPADRWHAPTRKAARVVLRQRWAAVQAVAEALLARGELDGGTAERLICEAMS